MGCRDFLERAGFFLQEEEIRRRFGGGGFGSRGARGVLSLGGDSEGVSVFLERSGFFLRKRFKVLGNWSNREGGFEEMGFGYS